MILPCRDFALPRIGIHHRHSVLLCQNYILDWDKMQEKGDYSEQIFAIEIELCYNVSRWGLKVSNIL